MDSRTILITGIVIAGVYFLTTQGKLLPSISPTYLSPTTPPAFPSPTESVNFPNPPASQDPILPPLNEAGVCPIVNREDYQEWSGEVVSEQDFPTVLAGARAHAGCFSPPNKS